MTCGVFGLLTWRAQISPGEEGFLSDNLSVTLETEIIHKNNIQSRAWRTVIFLQSIDKCKVSAYQPPFSFGTQIPRGENMSLN